MYFFKESILKKIKENETKPIIIKNFLTQKEINQLIKIESNSTYFVDRDDGRKRSLGLIGNKPIRNINRWHPTIKKILANKIKKIFPKTYIPKDEFPPHFFFTKYPTRLHADTGVNSKAIIYKQILIPLLSVPNNKAVRTIIFKEKWYGQASFFKKKIEKKNEKDFFLQDTKNNLIKIDNIKIFYKNIKNLNGFYKYKNKYFFKIDKLFKKKIIQILKKKSYNVTTNQHIKKNQKFNLKYYKKYLSHQSIDDFKGLTIDLNYKWKPGEALIWDRTRIHSSDNYLINGVKKKLAIAIFFNMKN